jgi:ABC-type Zn uptake system ZnuABC Zn-binding protein ZnuA
VRSFGYNTPPPRPFLLAFILFTLTGFFFFSFPSLSYAQAQPITVMASIFPIADMAKNVGGNHIQVRTILPPGASPHVFEPTAGTFKELAKARLFIQIGAGLELWSGKLLASAPKDIKVLTVSDGMPLIGRTASGYANPHIWLDPVLAIEVVRKIEAAFSQIDPAHAADYKKNAAAYIEGLKKLDNEIRRTVAGFKIKAYVSFHASWDYFARRYGLINEGAIEELPGMEPTPQKVRALIQKIKQKHLKAIFAEADFNPRTAQVIAAEAGARVVILDPEGSIVRDSYLHLMRYNLERMKEVMS